MTTVDTEDEGETGQDDSENTLLTEDEMGKGAEDEMGEGAEEGAEDETGKGAENETGEGAENTLVTEDDADDETGQEPASQNTGTISMSTSASTKQARRCSPYCFYAGRRHSANCAPAASACTPLPRQPKWKRHSMRSQKTSTARCGRN